MGSVLIGNFYPPIGTSLIKSVLSVSQLFINLQSDRHITGKRFVLFRRGVAQSGSAPALGAGCREFESLHPDHLLDLLVCKQLELLPIPKLHFSKISPHRTHLLVQFHFGSTFGSTFWVRVMSKYNSNLSNKPYFRSIIPKDLRKNFGGRDEFR